MPYVLARVQVRYGNKNLAQFNRALAVLTQLMADEGIALRNAMLVHMGRLYEVWDLWEVDDPGHMSRARSGLQANEEFRAVNAVLSELVEEEDLRYLEDLPYAPAR